MTEVQTLEGWYVLHDFRQIDWEKWKNVCQEEKTRMIDEWNSLARSWERIDENDEGRSVTFSILGHKADIALLHLRPTLQELQQIETQINKTRLADYTIRNHSYVSVVELSNYLAKGDKDPETDPYIQSRLKPAIPDTDHICFYPMNKRRDGADNWYMLSMEERRNMMRSHGMIGRKYKGKVTQMISGSIGFDDWEWGVTLFADDPVTFKKLIYEMRFDEVSARYADFGSFFVGNRLTRSEFESLLL